MNDLPASVPRARHDRAAPPVTVESVARVCAALADPTRLRILRLLQQGEVCVCDLHEGLALPQPTVSRHLAYLRRHGLVVGRKDGLWVYYRLAPLPPVLAQAVDVIVNAVAGVRSRDGRRRGQVSP